MRSGVRIAGGRFRGRIVGTPSGVRPTASKVRESLMDIWSQRLPGARFLELFAGTGAVALEAISRGAASAVLVERDPGVLVQLWENCGDLAGSKTDVLALDLPAGLAPERSSIKGLFDLIFADPPYEFAAYPELMKRAVALLDDNGELVIEHGWRDELPTEVDPLMQTDRRRYGDTCLSFYQLVTDLQD